MSLHEEIVNNQIAWLKNLDRILTLYKACKKMEDVHAVNDVFEDTLSMAAKFVSDFDRNNKK